MTEELSKPEVNEALTTATPAVVAMPEDYAHQAAYEEYLAWFNTYPEPRTAKKEFLEGLRGKYDLPWDLIRGWQMDLFALWHFERNPAYQTDFAVKVGVSQQALCHWHKDERFLALVQRMRLSSFIHDVPRIDRAIVRRAVKGDIPAATLVYKQVDGLLPQAPAAPLVNVNVSVPAQTGREHWEALPPRRPAGEFYEGEVVAEVPPEKPPDLS
mgnify:CR=1 FL=1